MPAIKSLADIAEKYASVTPGRSGDYQKGVQNPKRSWKTGAAAAKDAWGQGVTNAVSNNSFEKGVNRAGDEKWQRKCVEVGVTRFGPGVAAAKGDYQDGFAPYHAVIASTTLPPRGAKGDPRNYERVATLGRALHAKKMSG